MSRPARQALTMGQRTSGKAVRLTTEGGGGRWAREFSGTRAASVGKVLMPLCEVNGQWIRYEDPGGNLPPLVLAHGLLMDHEMFAPQVEALRSQCPVITWDARC